MDYNFLLDAVEIIFGVYIIYIAFQMKMSGKVQNNGLISKNVNLDRANDPAGYIKATFIPDIIAGLVLALCGVASRLSVGTAYYTTVQNVCMVVTVVALILFAIVIMKSQKKYLEGK